jgi:hypothetical protein
VTSPFSISISCASTWRITLAVQYILVAVAISNSIGMLIFDSICAKSTDRPHRILLQPAVLQNLKCLVMIVQSVISMQPLGNACLV